MKKILFLAAVITLVMTSCKKADFNNNTVTGEGLVDFALQAPASGTQARLNAATPAVVINFSWNAAKPGTTTPPHYKVVMALRSSGDLTNPLVQFDAGSNGTATSLALTYQQLDAALKAKGIADGAVSELVWGVIADNGSKQLMSQNTFFITVTRFKDGATPFFLLGPASTTTSVDVSPTSTSDNIKFNWTRSKPATGGPAVTYRILFAERKTDAEGHELAIDWSTQTLFRLAADNGGLDSTGTYTHKRFNDSLAAHGFGDPGTDAKLKWTVEATSGTWKQLSDYQNTLFISRLIKYVYPQALNVAGNHQGWAPETAPQLVALTPVGGPYSEYTGFIDFSNSPAEFKIVKGDNWGAGDYGGSTGVLTNGGSNLSVPSTGVYLVKANTTAMTWSADKINSFGLIGSATGSWDNDQDMTYNGTTKKYSITLNLSAGEVKFRANDSWDINLGTGATSGSLAFGGGNIAIGTAGNYTITLDVSKAGNWRYSVTRN
jgi:hypothetical protein